MVKKTKAAAEQNGGRLERGKRQELISQKKSKNARAFCIIPER